MCGQTRRTQPSADIRTRIFPSGRHRHIGSKKMSVLVRSLTAGLLAACLAAADTAPPMVLQLRVIDGEGAVYSAGSRATRGLAVKVTDENGNAVDGAAVSFQLPADGATGRFSNGGRTEIVSTKADGLASVWGMQWSKTPGAFEVHITASKGQARAGLAVAQTIVDHAA